ncbi:unnamed protein product, partial [Mesorhabditis spiculigera]
MVKKGCFFQDWTTAEARFEPGYYSTLASNRFYLCAEDMCNVDELTAKNSIANCTPNYPPFLGAVRRHGMMSGKL